MFNDEMMMLLNTDAKPLLDVVLQKIPEPWKDFQRYFSC